MITWAKLIDGSLKVWDKNWIEYNGRTITNPREKHFREAGYKELIYRNEILEEKEGYSVQMMYEESDAQIIGSPVYVEIPNVEYIEGEGEVIKNEDVHENVEA